MTLLLLFVIQLALVAITIKHHGVDDIYIFLFQCYDIGFAMIGVFCELELTETVRSTVILQYWTSRGLFYVYIALQVTQGYDNITLGHIAGMRVQLYYLSLTLIVLAMLYISLVSVAALCSGVKLCLYCVLSRVCVVLSESVMRKWLDMLSFYIQ